MLVTNGPGYGARVFTIDARSRHSSVPDQVGHGLSLQVSGDGLTALSTTHGGRLLRYSTRNWALIAEEGLPVPAHAQVSMSRDGETLAAVMPDGRVLVRLRGAIAWLHLLRTDDPAGVAVTPDGGYIAVAAGRRLTLFKCG
jgi:hypothetical protein